jgi:hypothetical protein
VQQEVSSAETLPSHANNDTGLRIQRTKSKELISFSPTDPEHPNNWPRKWKLQVFFAGFATVMNSTIASSLPSNAIPFIAEHFHVKSETQLVLPISCFLFGYASYSISVRLGAVCIG